ncbi:DUF4123 domain-containing protein [Burkholderia aenigmatica]|uniref:DUF4123 domain-containing protein n=1 Tax=Burkholderia aenigmatica TaxID=2015348 RepID=A0A228HSA7_9BURK|nr:DUF4123 domain-containing protein [Burkholderia aenigmatica]OXI32792.1 hypothetical protein CFB84_40620 [Burkholderia aenigmatica]
MSSPAMQIAVDQTGPLTSGYLLVEPATLDYAPDLAALDMRPCTPRVLAHREELMPRLIDLGSLDPDVRQTVTRYWHEEIDAERPPVACAWIRSAVEIDAVAAHIARYLVGPDAGGEPVFWRHYDPRVFALALAIFSPDQQQALLGPIQAWQFAWAGHIWHVDGPGVEADPAGQSLGWPRVDQWPRINRSEIVDRIRRRFSGFSVWQAARFPSMADSFLNAAAANGHHSATDELVDAAWQQLSHELASE